MFDKVFWHFFPFSPDRSPERNGNHRYSTEIKELFVVPPFDRRSVDTSTVINDGNRRLIAEEHLAKSIRAVESYFKTRRTFRDANVEVEEIYERSVRIILLWNYLSGEVRIHWQ